MKILLIDTPSNILDRSDPARVFVPLGPLCLAAVLREKGHDVQVYDPKLSATLVPYRGHFYLGDDIGVIESTVRRAAPDAVCVSTLFTRDRDNGLMIAEAAKRAAPGARIVMGGGHVNAVPEDYLRASPSVDYACAGECDLAVADVMEMLQGRLPPERVPGLVYRGPDGEPRFNGHALVQDLESLPLPAYDLLPVRRYFELQARGFASRTLGESPRSMSIITSRGCPYKCNFCSVYLTSGRRWRYQSPAYVMRHIEHLVERYGVEFIQFEDDALTSDRRRFEAILDGLYDRYGGRLRWGTPNGVRADSICNLDFLKKAKRAGVSYFNVAVESGDQEILDRVVNKHLQLKYVTRLAGMCRDLGIQLNAFYIIGFPGERVDQIQKTLDLALSLYREYSVFPHVNYAIPLYGTDLHKEVEAKGMLDRELSAQSLLETTHFRGRGLIRTEEFTPETLREMMLRFSRRLVVRMMWRMATRWSTLLQYARLALRYPYLLRRYILGT
jgi:radical SAM superfamily enzyme YgiQ (UPF0313 family)